MEDELVSRRILKLRKKLEEVEAEIARLARLKAQEAAETYPNVAVEEQLTSKALRIKEINKLAKDASLSGSNYELEFLKSEYVGLTKGIRKLLFHKGSYCIINKEAKEIIQKICYEEPLEIDKLIPGINKQFKDMSDDNDEIGDIILSEDYILPGTTVYNIMANRLCLCSLILGINVPVELELFINEAKQCYGLNSYIAVYCLCRSMLETCIKDICWKCYKRNKGNVNDLISQISSGKLSYRSIRIYRETSSLIHGRKIIDSDEARKMFTKTIKVIQELYDANMILISGNNA